MTEVQRFFKYTLDAKYSILSETNYEIIELKIPADTPGVIIYSAADNEFACKAEYDYFIDKLKQIYNITHLGTSVFIYNQENSIQNKYVIVFINEYRVLSVIDTEPHNCKIELL